MVPDYDTLRDALRVLHALEVTAHNVPLNALTQIEDWELRVVSEGVVELKLGPFTIVAYLED